MQSCTFYTSDIGAVQVLNNRVIASPTGYIGVGSSWMLASRIFLIVGLVLVQQGKLLWTHHQAMVMHCSTHKENELVSSSLVGL